MIKLTSGMFLLCLLYVVSSLEPIHLEHTRCQANQKERLINGKPICCFTITCQPGQNFKLCTEDNGHDTCQNCMPGYHHLDEINTALFNDEVDPCVLDDDCSEGDVAMIYGECICNLKKGYYGRDRNKCGVDDGRCKKAGYQLTRDGVCVPCDEEHFKDEEDYGLCRNKTRCGYNQEVDDHGSPKRDRTCRAKNVKFPQSHPGVTPVSPALLPKFNYTDKGNVTKVINGTQPPKTIFVTKTKEDNDTIIIAFSVPLAIAAVAVIVFLIVICWRYQKDRDRKKTTIEKNVTYNINGVQSLIIGNNNTHIERNTYNYGRHAESLNHDEDNASSQLLA